MKNETRFNVRQRTHKRGKKLMQQRRRKEKSVNVEFILGE